MVEIFWTDESKDWLKEIHDYIAADSQTNARKVVENIIDRAESFKDFPSIGQRLLQWPDHEIRMILKVKWNHQKRSSGSFYLVYRKVGKKDHLRFCE